MFNRTELTNWYGLMTREWWLRSKNNLTILHSISNRFYASTQTILNTLNLFPRHWSDKIRVHGLKQLNPSGAPMSKWGNHILTMVLNNIRIHLQLNEHWTEAAPRHRKPNESFIFCREFICPVCLTIWLFWFGSFSLACLLHTKRS